MSLLLAEHERMLAGVTPKSAAYTSRNTHPQPSQHLCDVCSLLHLKVRANLKGDQY